jgi:hypothetical protein
MDEPKVSTPADAQFRTLALLKDKVDEVVGLLENEIANKAGPAYSVCVDGYNELVLTRVRQIFESAGWRVNFSVGEVTTRLNISY